MKFIKRILVVLYIFFILTQTVIGRAIQPEPVFQGLFWELRNGMWTDISLNIILFIPLGFLIDGWKGVLIGFTLSCVIETVQYVGHLGFCELDDVLNNTIGTGIGVVLSTIIQKALSYFLNSKQDRIVKRESD